MASSMTVKFLSPLAMGARISFKLGNTEIYFNVVSQRIYANEIQYNSSINTIATNYKNAITADYPTLVTATVGGDTVTITSNNDIANFTSGTVIGGGTVNFTYNNTVVGNITVDGMNSTNYLINNDIIIRLGYDALRGGYFRLQLENQTTGKSTNFITAQQGADGSALINLSPIIKGIFSYPTMKINALFSSFNFHNGCDTIKINISYINGAGQVNYTVTKRFIRGGKRTDRTNLTVPLGYLMPTPKLPVWTGRELTISQLTPNGIQITSLADFPEANKVYMQTKGCDSTYVKFINQNGGYSYWLFENITDSESNGALGSYVRIGGGISDGASSVSRISTKTGYQDLGNTSDVTLSLSSKVPAEFLPYMNDLVISPDIYFYDTKLNMWHHATSARNTVPRESNRKAYQVKINLNVDNRFNPSLLWSN